VKSSDELTTRKGFFIKKKLNLSDSEILNNLSKLRKLNVKNKNLKS
jgi:hypothetical protein